MGAIPATNRTRVSPRACERPGAVRSARRFEGIAARARRGGKNSRGADRYQEFLETADATELLRDLNDSSAARRRQRLNEEGDVSFYNRMEDNMAAATTSRPSDVAGVSDGMGFAQKVGAAWNIFFPNTRRRRLSPRDTAKERLSLILVADRCSLSSEVMSNMKESIVRALEDYVEVESKDDVDLSVTADDDLGTVYSVSVPVRCVRPEKRGYFVPEGERGDLSFGAEWDDLDKDPASRFPFGT